MALRIPVDGEEELIPVQETVLVLYRPSGLPVGAVRGDYKDRQGPVRDHPLAFFMGGRVAGAVAARKGFRTELMTRSRWLSEVEPIVSRP